MEGLLKLTTTAFIAIVCSQYSYVLADDNNGDGLSIFRQHDSPIQPSEIPTEIATETDWTSAVFLTKEVTLRTGKSCICQNNRGVWTQWSACSG